MEKKYDFNMDVHESRVFNVYSANSLRVCVSRHAKIKGQKFKTKTAKGEKSTFDVTVTRTA